MPPRTRDNATSITNATVKAALKRAAAGETFEIPDAACPGLTLRCRGGELTWSIRGRVGIKRRRWNLGAPPEVSPTVARERGWRVKEILRVGGDPTYEIRAIVTGISVSRQLKTIDSISWPKARNNFLGSVFANRRPATYHDYRKFLENTDELEAWNKRDVATISAEDVSEMLAIVAKAHGHSYAEHLQRVISSMWGWLADASRRRETGVQPRMLHGVTAPERPRREVGEGRRDETEDDAPPSEIEIGRVIAIARSGALPRRASNALLLLAGTVQRRRAVIGAHQFDFQNFGDETLWKMPPYFRKTANMKRSKNRHLVPLVGWVAEAEKALDRTAFEGPWYFPVGATPAGVQPRNDYSDPSYLTHLMGRLPGIEFSPHGFRAAFATHGKRELGWQRHDAKLILDHLEGHDPGDVTAQFYNTDPEILKKREMMRGWIGLLDKWAAEAIKADPDLLDRDKIAEAIYRKRYGDKRWKAMVERCAKTGATPSWLIDEDERERLKKERSRLKAEKAAAKRAAQSFDEAAE